MNAPLARGVIRLAAHLAPASIRVRWREEWLAELAAATGGRASRARVAGAVWDALSSHWTTRRGPGPLRLWRGRREVHQGWRSLRRAPWYALTTAGVIALSMAFATTIFAIVDGVLFKPLPYPASDRLFTVVENANPVSSQPSPASPSPAQLNIWREALPEAHFATYVAFKSGSFTLKSGPRADVLTSVMVGAGFFETLGVDPLFGRFGPDDFVTSPHVAAAIVSYEFWQQWCGGDPSAVGRPIVDDEGHGIRVVGVLPRGFVGSWGFHADIVTPYTRASNDRDRGGFVLIRLPAQWTNDQVASRLSSLDTTLAESWPVSSSPSPTLRYRSAPVGAVTLEPLRTTLTGTTRQTSWLVLAAALSLMALGCLNVGGLAAARVQDRWRDLALRRALGADGWDLVRLIAIESTMVVAIGTVAGFAASAPLVRLTMSLVADPVELLKLPGVDWRVAAFSALAAGACVALITAVAARTLSRMNTPAALADGPTMSGRRRWSSWSIVSGQIALALIMCVGGALVAGSLLRVWSEDPGFDLARTARIRMSPPDGATAAEIEILLDDLRRLPGVAQAGGVAGSIASGFSFYGSDFDAPPGSPVLPPGAAPGTVGVLAQSLRMTRGYLEAAGLQVVDGRLPTAGEFEGGSSVLVVSETLARGYWPGQRAVGQTLVTNKYERGPKRTFTVVGVVRDARYAALDKDPYGAIYYPNAASSRPWLGNVLIQFAEHSPTSLAGADEWIRARCPRCMVYGQAQTLADLMSTSILPRAFRGWLFAAFGLASLIVVGVGILGLMAMKTSRRTREIGIRLALGATPAGVTEQMLREQMGAVVAGVVAGSLVAAWAVRFVKSYLYKLPLYDIPVWAAAIGALLLVAMIGALIPAVRASRVDPVRALRVE